MSDRGATLVLGLGVAGRAVLEALVRRGLDVAAVDDRPGEVARAAANRLGVELVEAPEPGDWPMRPKYPPVLAPCWAAIAIMRARSALVAGPPRPATCPAVLISVGLM